MSRTLQGILAEPRSRDADSVNSTAATTMLGRATVELVRALLSTAGNEANRAGALEDVLLARIVAYVQHDVGNPELSPELIAHEHNMSVRNLYRTWATHDLSLTEWVMTQRLEAARRELTSPRQQDRTISSIAQRWGFADSTHFARRFRGQYGMSPLECRQKAANDQFCATRLQLPPAT